MTNSLKGQRERVSCPWRCREGPGQMEDDLVANSWNHHCGPPAVCQPRLFQQRGLGVDTDGAKLDGAAANFPVNPDVCLIWKLKNVASIKVAFQSCVLPRLWQGHCGGSELGPLIIPKEAGRHGSG